jgi:hypothetical protein
MYEKGHEKKGGRKKGTPNKNTQERKDELEALFHKELGFQSLIDDVNEIEDPKDRADQKMKVMAFFMAKHKSVEHTGENPFENIILNFTPSKVKLPSSESEVIKNNLKHDVL